MMAELEPKKLVLRLAPHSVRGGFMKKLFAILVLLLAVTLPAVSQVRLSLSDQQRFDSYYSRWQQYRATNNASQVVSMEKRMQDVYSHYGIPPNTPYGRVASSGNAASNAGTYRDPNWNRNHAPYHDPNWREEHDSAWHREHDRDWHREHDAAWHREHDQDWHHDYDRDHDRDHDRGLHRGWDKHDHDHHDHDRDHHNDHDRDHDHDKDHHR
jgi:hypothetical protein